MSNTQSIQKSNTQEIIGWDAAIEKAESEIAKVKRHLLRLKAARAVFLKSKKIGMPWPEGGLRGQEERFWKGAKEKDKNPRRAGAA